MVDCALHHDLHFQAAVCPAFHKTCLSSTLQNLPLHAQNACCTLRYPCMQATAGLNPNNQHAACCS